MVFDAYKSQCRIILFSFILLDVCVLNICLQRMFVFVRLGLLLIMMTPVGTKTSSTLISTRSTEKKTSLLGNRASTEAPTTDAGADADADHPGDEGKAGDFVPIRTYRPYGQGLPRDSRDTESFKNASLFILTIANTLLSICCIVISIIMLYFRIKAHRTKSMGLVQILYLQNGLADFFVGLGVLLQSPILFLMIWKGRETSYITVPVYISYFLTAIGVKMSMFMNCVLGVVRCINIVQPFYQINKKALTMCTISYMVIWSVIVGLDLWQFTVNIGTINQVRIVKALVMKGQPGFGLVLLTMNKEQYGPSYFAFHLGNLVQFILPTALPAVLCFVLMIVQLCHRRKKSGGRELRQGQKMARQANDSISKARLTIFLLTNIYVSTSAESIITRLTLHGRKVYLGSKATYEDLLKSAETTQKW